MVSAGGGSTAEAARRGAEARFGAAHRALVEDPSVQFRPTLTPPPAKPPRWLHELGEWLRWALRPVGRLLRWIAHHLPDWPYARILLWGVVGLLAVVVLWMAVERIRYGVWRLPRWRRRRKAAAEPTEGSPLFEPGPVRAWLEEADALAALGRFADAAHLLLLRSVEDLARRRPGFVTPALTARELAAAGAFPSAVRTRFAAIAALVERSLFGGRPVDATDWQRARTSYAELATAGTWRT